MPVIDSHRQALVNVLAERPLLSAQRARTGDHLGEQLASGSRSCAACVNARAQARHVFVMGRQSRVSGDVARHGVSPPEIKQRQPIGSGDGATAVSRMRWSQANRPRAVALGLACGSAAKA